MTILEYLSQKSYPGRFLLAGNDKDGKKVLAYAIMGRSEQSRNRIFVKEDGALKTKAYDESLVKDPSLIIYNAMRVLNENIILTNGDQTDTIFEELEKGNELATALSRRTFEPDEPNYTPRISVLYNTENNSYSLSIIKKNDDEAERIIWNYPQTNGICHVIHTYENDGTPLPTFSSDPLIFTLPDTLEELKEMLWTGLNEDNKISLFILWDEDEVIINKNGGENA